MNKKQKRIAFDLVKLNDVKIIGRGNTLNGRLVYGDLDENDKDLVLENELGVLNSNTDISFDKNELSTVSIICQHENLRKYYVEDRELEYFEPFGEHKERVIDEFSVYRFECTDCGYSHYFIPFVDETYELDYKEEVISENRLNYGNLTQEEQELVLNKELKHHHINISPMFKKIKSRY